MFSWDPSHPPALPAYPRRDLFSQRGGSPAHPMVLWTPEASDPPVPEARNSNHSKLRLSDLHSSMPPDSAASLRFAPKYKHPVLSAPRVC